MQRCVDRLREDMEVNVRGYFEVAGTDDVMRVLGFIAWSEREDRKG